MAGCFLFSPRFTAALSLSRTSLLPVSGQEALILRGQCVNLEETLQEHLVSSTSHCLLLSRCPTLTSYSMGSMASGLERRMDWLTRWLELVGKMGLFSLRVLID